MLLPLSMIPFVDPSTADQRRLDVVYHVAIGPPGNTSSVCRRWGTRAGADQISSQEHGSRHLMVSRAEVAAVRFEQWWGKSSGGKITRTGQSFNWHGEQFHFHSPFSPLSNCFSVFRLTSKTPNCHDWFNILLCTEVCRAKRCKIEFSTNSDVLNPTPS